MSDVAPEKIAAAVEVDQPPLVRVHKYRDRAQLENRQRRSECRERGGQHQISRPASQNLQRDFDGVQAAGHSDRVPGSPIRRKRRFKLPNLSAEDVPAVLGHLEERRQGGLAKVRPTAVKVVSRDHNPI